MCKAYNKSCVWILTEERPKVAVVCKILQGVCGDTVFNKDTRIVPILKDGKFTFVYTLVGFTNCVVSDVFIKIVSGKSSFVDFLVFYQDTEPKLDDIPVCAIEETKTDDSESRNTAIYQRCTKFVYINYVYPGIRKIMLYNLQITPSKKPTQTNIFGTRLLLTMGVDIQVVDEKIIKERYAPFSSVDELIDFKSCMRNAPVTNVPISITKKDDRIEISGRLYKNGSLAHDPNIGALSAISCVLRKLGWDKDIIITKHGLEQKHVGKNNKFVQIANKLNIKLDGIDVPKADIEKEYWHYENSGEKLATIFLHLAIENYANGKLIFENHAGCEKGYFLTPNDGPVPLQKYENRVEYKSGNKAKIIHIPDLVMFDVQSGFIVEIEGKKYSKRINGVNQIKLYDAFDEEYVNKYYPGIQTVRTVVLYGSNNTKVVELDVGFLLNENGDLILGPNPPSLIKKAIETAAAGSE